MDDGRLKLNRPRLLAVPLRDAETLLEAGDGDGALLYLYLLKNGGELDMERAAAELRLSVRAVRLIAARLERLGLLSAGERASVQPELPECRAEDVVRRSRTDPDFQALVEEAQATMGRVLSSTDLKALFTIYDELALPADVIMLLIHHCKEENDRRYGAERHLGFAVIKKTAAEWFDRELVTAELAEEHLEKLARQRTLAGEIQQAMGIRGRELSPTEQKYILSWIELGFGPEELALAADRTVTNTGQLRWRYMDSIVRSWHSKGLHTVAQIEQGDRKSSGRGRESVADPAPDARELERMQKLRDKLNRS